MNNLSKHWPCQFILATVLALSTGFPAGAQQTRVLGIDVSYWQTEISVTDWATLKRATNQQVSGVFGDGRDFVWIRSSRGGTTGIDKRQGGFPSGQNTFYELSQRYDDPYFVQNITRSTAAGLFAGSYHFARPDVVATTLNSGGIANTGTDEADHMLEMAKAWMRPGYLLPVFDLESGNPERTRNELAQFCIDFSNRIYEVMGIRPVMYINGSYSSYLQSASNPSALVTAFPVLWDARYTSNDDPSSTAFWTGHPKDSSSSFYGPWDDFPNPTHPWNFWQYGSTARLNGYKNGGGNIDVNVAQGGMEFLKDHLIPALWMNDSSGQWTTLTNWNSGTTPVAPAQGPGQVARIGALTLPTTRLPSSNDTLILERPNANITVTLSSGTQSIRKLYMRETLAITGGLLDINYIPSWDSTPLSAQFSGPVTLSGGGSLSVHTLQVDTNQTFTLGGGTLTFDTIKLMPHGTTPAKIVVSGNVNLNPLSNVTATIAKGSGSGSTGFIDLGGASRTLTVGNGSEDIDLSIDVPLSNGSLVKAGAGTMRVTVANTYSSGTTISAGRLLLNSTTGSGTGNGAVSVNGGTLAGTGTIAGAVTVNTGGTISPGLTSSLGTLTLSNAPAFNGTNFMEINRNGGSSLADRIVLTSGTLNYGGTLVVSNVGATLIGGETFGIFSANAYSGSFGATQLPSLNSGLNWYLGNLTINGSIKVNRRPVANLMTFTNTPGAVVKIPISALVSNGSDPDGDSISLAGFNSTTTNGIALSSDGTFISYSSNGNGFDEFTYTLSDGKGGIGTGIARIEPSRKGHFLNHPSVNNNSLSMSLAGYPGSTYYLERSTNLPFWVTISTNVAQANGMFSVNDSIIAPPASVFYRLRWSP